MFKIIKNFRATLSELHQICISTSLCKKFAFYLLLMIDLIGLQDLQNVYKFELILIQVFFS